MFKNVLNSLDKILGNKIAYIILCFITSTLGVGVLVALVAAMIFELFWLPIAVIVTFFIMSLCMIRSAQIFADTADRKTVTKKVDLDGEEYILKLHYMTWLGTSHYFLAGYRLERANQSQ